MALGWSFVVDKLVLVLVVDGKVGDVDTAVCDFFVFFRVFFCGNPYQTVFV